MPAVWPGTVLTAWNLALATVRVGARHAPCTGQKTKRREAKDLLKVAREVGGGLRFRQAVPGLPVVIYCLLKADVPGAEIFKVTRRS